MIVTRQSTDGVVADLVVSFDEPYLQSVLDEFNAEHSKQLTLDQAKNYLADHIMDDAYYAFRDWLEGEGHDR